MLDMITKLHKTKSCLEKVSTTSGSGWVRSHEATDLIAAGLKAAHPSLPQVVLTSSKFVP
jgi:hypothetical protein